MKSLQELNAIRERMQKQTLNRDAATENSTRVVVGHGYLRYSRRRQAGYERVSRRGFQTQFKARRCESNGCIGMCKLEPIVEVFVPGQEKVTYVKVTPEKVSRIVAEHIVNNQPVKEFTVDEK